MNLNISGIYKITNNINKKSYIGLAKNIGKRWKQHKDIDANSINKNLYWAFNEYGLENFSFTVIKECEPNKLGYWEKKLIAEHDTFNNGYNTSKGGEGANAKTLSDKYDISYFVKTIDLMNYKKYTTEQNNAEKYFEKSSQLSNKIKIKVDKWAVKNKDKKIIRVSKRYDKKIEKADKTANFWNDIKLEIINSNDKKYNFFVKPIKEFSQLDFNDLQEYTSMDGLNNLQMLGLGIRRWQKNYVQYKETSPEMCKGNLKFRGNKMIFNLEGRKNTSLYLEELKSLTIFCTPEGYKVDINNASIRFSRLNGACFLSNDVIDYPRGNVVFFKNADNAISFVTLLRRIMGT